MSAPASTTTSSNGDSNKPAFVKPPQRRYKDLPVPFFFREASAAAFQSMTMFDSDIIASTQPKAGTTWLQKILFSLLHGFDDDGISLLDVDGEKKAPIGSQGQVYPESLPIDEAELKLATAEEGGDSNGVQKFVGKIFGMWTLQDLFNQPAPRIFATHLCGDQFLPTELLQEEGGKGKMIVVLRNLKDTSVSLHFFMGVAKDDWLGNEHGPGSFHRFIDENTPNSYGSQFTFIQKVNNLASRMGKRLLIVYFEALKMDLPTQLDRINAFLERPPLTDAKRTAVAEACGFQSMKKDASVNQMLLRKGSIGDWKNYLSQKEWKQFDEVFERKLGNVPLADPLRFFQWMEVPGVPPIPVNEWSLQTDPRSWDVYIPCKLEDGMVIPERLAQPEKVNFYTSPPATFCTTPLPNEDHPAVVRRYHLFVAPQCPYSSCVLATLHLLGLQNVIGTTLVDGQSSAGWVCLKGTSALPWRDAEGPFFLYQLYQAHDSRCTSKISAPVLWDEEKRCIVSNNFWDIVGFLCKGFGELGQVSPEVAHLLYSNDNGAGYTLLPAAMYDSLATLYNDISNHILAQIDIAGTEWLQNKCQDISSVIEARNMFYEKLQEYSTKLATSKSKFLCGDKLTAVDILLGCTLMRYDAAYRVAFGLGGGGLLVKYDNDKENYHNLRVFVRNVYRAIKPTVNLPSFREVYRVGQAVEAQLRREGLLDGEVKVAYEKELPDLDEILASLEQQEV